VGKFRSSFGSPKTAKMLSLTGNTALPIFPSITESIQPPGVTQVHTGSVADDEADNDRFDETSDDGNETCL
jgi:hypothetical protein